MVSTFEDYRVNVKKNEKERHGSGVDILLGKQICHMNNENKLK